ncbi:ras-related protein Rab-24-like [Schistocerca nitens]|uniref:ras-related protein Rab-24-like n=1 Tax=Schistocerca nitens TaxID=7011 RepID=UPI002118EE54|nr:ras-related protein Rab-24-like [Schistocerca nitens]
MSKVDVKVVLLGSEYVGKTSLLERYVHDRFRSNLPYQNTIGAAFAAKVVTLRGKKFTVGVWDTAGSERYEAMSRIYYRGAKAAIVCYDITNRASWDRAKFWVNELRRFEEDCKVYLCGTKYDTVSEGTPRQVEIGMAEKYAEGLQANFIETSSKTGYNVDKLFQMIAEDYLDSPEPNKIEETITLTQLNKRRNCCP